MKRSLTSPEPEARSHKTARLDAKGVPSAHPTLAYPSHLPPPTTPAFAQPAPLLTFSYDEAHVQHFDDRALRKLRPAPPIDADLNHGYERWTRRAEARPRLDGLLRALEKAPGVTPGVSTWRGVMTRVLTAPYEDRDVFSVNVMCVGGRIYIEEHLSDAQLREKNDLQPKQRRQMYYGYSFESWSTADLDAPPVPGLQWGGDVNTNEQWCVVAKTRLGTERLVIGGEVDCVRERYTGKTDSLVELKTSMTIRGAQDEARFEKKLLKFYFQSFLLGVPEIMVGFRTPAGRVTSVQAFKTMEIPRLVRGKPGAWDPRVCLAWGDSLLRFLRDVVTKKGETQVATNTDKNQGTDIMKDKEASKDPNRRVWRLTFTPGKGANIRELGDEEVLEVQREEGEEDTARIGFLPQWHWDWICGRDDSSDDTSAPSTSSTHAAGASPIAVPSAARTALGTKPVRTDVDGWQL